MCYSAVLSFLPLSNYFWSLWAAPQASHFLSLVYFYTDESLLLLIYALSDLLWVGFSGLLLQPLLHVSTVYECVSLCSVLYLEAWCGSLQGSNRLQHALQFTTLMQRRHVAAASNTLLTDEHPRDLQYKRNRGAAGKYSVTDFSVSCIWLGDMTMKTTLQIKIWGFVYHQRFCHTIASLSGI